MSRAVILKHARRHLAGRGRIEVKNCEHGANGIYEACVVLTCAESVEYYHAHAGWGAVAMFKTRTEPLPTLPLFEDQDAEVDT